MKFPISRLLLSQVIDQIPAISTRHQTEAGAMMMKRRAMNATEESNVDYSVRSNIFIEVSVVMMIRSIC